TPAMSTISRLNPTARTLAVYASQSGLLHTAQDSLPDGWPSFPGRVNSLLGPYERFQITALIPSSFPKLPWRTPVLCPISIGSGIGRYQGDARSGRRKSLSAMGLAHTREISTYMVEAVGSTTYKPGVAGSKPAPPTNKIKGFSAIPAVQPDFWIPN